MFVRSEHQLTDREALFSLIESYPLGAWVCTGADGFVANHIPLLLDRARGPFGTLIGHVSRSNKVWLELKGGKPSVVIFQGAQAYITPGWYPSKAKDGRVVPTWNYAVVHAHGIARAIEDRLWLLDMLNRLTEAHEAKQPMPWSVSDAPASYIDKLLRSIVGIEIPIEMLEGKLKASQDEALQDRFGTITGLKKESCGNAKMMAEIVMDTIRTCTSEQSR